MSNIYSTGLHHVGAYQVAGRPYCATGSANGEDEITFPQVTKQIVVLNTDSADDLYVYFSSSAPDGNKYKIAYGEQQTFNVKCKQVYLSGSSGCDYSLYASLTHIDKNRMYALTGSGISE